MYKIEDERFELDIIMEVNLSAIRALESVQLHMNSISPDQLNHFQLDDQLGGQSSVTQKQAIQRIYGDRANEIIDGLKRNPRVAVPIVLKRFVDRQNADDLNILVFNHFLDSKQKTKSGAKLKRTLNVFGKSKAKNTT